MGLKRTGAVFATAALLATGSAACGGSGKNPEQAKGPECMALTIEGQPSVKPKNDRQLLGEMAVAERRIKASSKTGCFIGRLVFGECLVIGPSAGTGDYSTSMDATSINIDTNDGTHRSINEYLIYSFDKKSLMFGPAVIVSSNMRTGKPVTRQIPGPTQQLVISDSKKGTGLISNAIVLWNGVDRFVEATGNYPVMTVTSEATGSAKDFPAITRAIGTNRTCVLPVQAPAAI